MKGALFLPVYEKGFLNDNQELLPALLERRHGARLALAVCTNWRRAAIAVLLQSGRANQFHRRLQRSGSAFLHFIRGTPPSSTRLTDSAPFLDAIAAGDFATADDIARHSNHRWIEDEEYEEDFLFYEFLMTHALPGAPADPANAILDRWDACLAGTDDQRLPVCHAMVGKDAAAFDAALIDYLDAREKDQREQLPMMEPEAAATEASVSIEGLALRQLAARRGLATAAEHPQIPVPLVPQSVDWPFESFRSID
jgi:hypothetical protein